MIEMIGFVGVAFFTCTTLDWLVLPGVVKERPHYAAVVESHELGVASNRKKGNDTAFMTTSVHHGKES